MSALGVQSQINKDRALWLSSIPTDVIHGNVICDTLFANAGYISTLFSDNINVSTLNASSLNLTTSDVSGMFVSSLRGNTAFFSSMTLASDLSGGVGFVRFSVDASGIQVDGDPIRFDNLVYLTSTINIIQVSTLVDTDIFASNGFFSTLSSGSFSSGLAHISSLRVEDLSANNGTFNTLFVSTLEALDISGVAASNWSQYPTLNSSIIFQPAYILSNISNKLYFAGQELTDLSGGGVDWSFFNALTDVSMNNFSLRGLSTLQYQDGARLYSQTGNNLFYNGQPVQYGAASNVSQWSRYPAVANVNMSQSTLSNALLVSSSNLALSGSNITNGNTFTNSLGVGGTSLLSLATITSGGDLTCRNIDVGDQTTSLADVNIYGATALPGDSALYVEGGVQFSGGTVHGFSAGVLPVAGINTGRIDMLQAGFNILHPLVGAITTGAALGITSGGAMSLAAGGYVEMNTSTLQMINTSQGNKNTTVQAGFLTVDPDIAPTSSIKLFNTLGGGVEIDGGGQGSLQGFSTVNAQFISSLSTNANTSRVNFAFVSTMFANFILCQSSVFNNIAVNNIKIADDITGVTNAPNPLESRIINFSSINSFNVSTTDLWVSSINGLAVDLSGGGGGSTLSSFTTAQASTFHVSSLRGFPNNDSFAGSSLSIETGLQFVGFAPANPAATGRWISSLRTINDVGEDFSIFASTMFLSYSGGVNSNGFIRVGGGGFNDTIFRQIDGVPGISTAVITAVSSIASEFTVSTIKAPGGLPIKVNNPLEFVSLNGINNVDVINTSGPAVPVLAIAASTIQLNTNNVLTPSLSTIRHQTSTLSASTITTGLYQGQAIGVSSMSTVQLALSTIQMYEQSGITPPGLSSLMNIGYGYDISGGANGFWIENYINSVDNLDFGLVGNADGAYITSWTNGRSSYSELFLKANTMTLNIDDSVLVSDNNSGSFTQIGPTYLTTVDLNVSTINGNDARPAYTNNLTLSSMTLIPASTTLMYWDTVTTSSNINTSTYDAQVRVTGAYKIGASFQFISAGSSDEVEFFLLKNNSVISQSGGIVEVQNNAEEISYAESVEQLIEGDTIQIGCFTNGSGVFVSTINGNVIQSPACILTMYKVD